MKKKNRQNISEYYTTEKGLKCICLFVLIHLFNYFIYVVNYYYFLIFTFILDSIIFYQ